MKFFALAIRDIILFIVLSVLATFLLSEFKGSVSNIEALVVIVFVSIITLYSYLVNKTDKLSIAYGLLIGIGLTFVLASRDYSANRVVFLIALIFSCAYYYSKFKRNKHN